MQLTDIKGRLPNDIINIILNYLTPKELLQIAKVSKEWQKKASEDGYWKKWVSPYCLADRNFKVLYLRDQKIRYNFRNRLWCLGTPFRVPTSSSLPAPDPYQEIREKFPPETHFALDFAIIPSSGGVTVTIIDLCSADYQVIRLQGRFVAVGDDLTLYSELQGRLAGGLVAIVFTDSPPPKAYTLIDLINSLFTFIGLKS